jgi:DNA polymerase elongation subunit (family B)
MKKDTHFISKMELGEQKTPYEGTLDQLYNKDFVKFIEYNRQDVALLGRLDAKLKFIDLSNELAHQNTVLIQTTMGAVAVTEQGIVNEAHRRGMVVPDRVRREPGSDPAAGAYVAYPKKGLQDWIGSIDINSLYPSVIRRRNRTQNDHGKEIICRCMGRRIWINGISSSDAKGSSTEHNH